MGDKELTTEQWKEEKRKKKAQMTAMQALPYEVKVRRAELRAREYIAKLDDMGLEAHVSVGGLDSITLLVFLRSIGIDVPAISVSALEDKSIQRVHKELGVIPVKIGKPKAEVLNEFGFPVISKRIAGKIDTLQNPTEKNRTVRHAIITGECGAQGHFATNSRMKLPQKWLELFAGYENENEGVNYKIAPFKVSNKCCLYMKERPCMTCVFEKAYGKKHPYWKKRTLLQKIGYDKMSALRRSLFAGTIYIVVFFGIMVGWLEIAERSIVLGAAVMIVFHAVTASAVTKWILTKME